tara:strand:- start:199 stop:396 length:198 start_codon:yes stop_codon:yes gene_type:complete
MWIALGIIIGFLLAGNLIIAYLDYREEKRNQKKLKENMQEFKTRIGALHSDRHYERTSIPKRNGK